MISFVGIGWLRRVFAAATHRHAIEDVDRLSVSLAGMLPRSGGRIDGDLSISGSFHVAGSQVVVETETVRASDNFLILNAGEVGPGVTRGTAGIEVDRGAAARYRFVFDEATSAFRVGETDSTQAVATREDAPLDGGYARWSADRHRWEAVDADAIGPIGRIEVYPSETAIPSTCLECDGRSLLRAEYPALFQRLLTSWGVGADAEGETTFSLPRVARKTMSPPGGTATTTVTVTNTVTAEDGTTTETETTVVVPLARLITVIRAR